MKRSLLVLCLGLCACGGSGGGDGDSPQGGTFAGTWVANFTPTKNDCNLQLPPNFGNNVIFLINQDGQNIAIQNIATGGALTGAANPDNTALIAGATVAVNCTDGTVGQERVTVSMEEVRDGSGLFYFEDVFNCSGSICTVVAAGNAQRDE